MLNNMKATHVRLGIRYAGQCAVCGKWTGDRDFERDGTSLYRWRWGRYGFRSGTGRAMTVRWR